MKEARLRPLAVLFTTGALLAGCFTGSGRAAVCGSTDPATSKPVHGNLTLDPGSSHANLKLHRSTKDHDLTLTYNLSGCDLPATTPVVNAKLLHLGDQQLPKGAVTFDNISWDGGQLEVTGTVHPKTFDPAVYNEAVKITSDAFGAEVTPITVSRSTASPLHPILAAVIGALIALIASGFTLVRSFSDGFSIRYTWLAVAIIVAIAFGAWVLTTDYLSNDVEVWAGASDWVKTGRDAFAGASVAAVTGILGRAIVARVQTALAARST